MLCCNNVLRILSQSLKPQPDSLCLTFERPQYLQVCLRIDGESSCLLLSTSSPFPSMRRRWRSRQSLKVRPRCLNSGCGVERVSGSRPENSSILERDHLYEIHDGMKVRMALVMGMMTQCAFSASHLSSSRTVLCFFLVCL